MPALLSELSDSDDSLSLSPLLPPAGIASAKTAPKPKPQGGRVSGSAARSAKTVKVHERRGGPGGRQPPVADTSDDDDDDNAEGDMLLALQELLKRQVRARTEQAALARRPRPRAHPCARARAGQVSEEEGRQVQRRAAAAG